MLDSFKFSSCIRKTPTKSNSINFVYFKSEKPKNNSDIASAITFYGPASSCEELRMLGFTLNGFYLVDGKDKLKKGQTIEVIECRFKQPHGSEEGIIL